MKKRILALITVLVVALSCVSPSFAADTSATQIKNVIYMIPDGGGMTPFYLADELKQAGGWDRDVFPNSTVTEKGEMYLKQYLVGSVTTYSADAEITDSAAAGTALSTGYKTKNGYVGINPDAVPNASILEAAQYSGKNVGMVTTYEWTNATPAAFSAHNINRGNYTAMSEQIVNQGIDVVLGGGFAAAKWGDISQAEVRGYDIIENRAELEAVKPGDKIWGNLVGGAFPYDTEYAEDTPHLAEMVKAAITALDHGDEGFFLMVEGSKIDGGGHSNYAVGMVGEYLAFDEACKVALNYAEGRNDTIVVILPDHDTGGMVLPEDTNGTVESLVKGLEPKDVTWESAEHTARDGGVFMYIPEGAEYPEGISGNDRGTDKAFKENVIDNTVIAPYLAKVMGIDLAETTKQLFVDVTEMGEYNTDLGVFKFADYPVVVRNDVSYACVNNKVVDLDGQVTALINGRFYVPQLLLDIAQGKAEYKLSTCGYPLASTMDTYMPDTTNVKRWNARVKVSNFLLDKELSGKIRFTYPEALAVLGEKSIKVDGFSTDVFEFECYDFPSEDVGLEFKYDVITDSGEVYSFASKFKGLAYAGYAGGEVVIDGVIDDEAWKNGVVMTCDDASRIVQIEDWKGDRDLSADFSIIWDEEYFYMYAVVTDEIFSPYTNEVKKIWQGDSVQFGIYNDTENAMVNGTAGSKFEEIGIAYVGEKPVAYRYVSQKGTTEKGEIMIGDGFELACVRKGDDITYELKYRWSDLFGYEYTPQIGGVLGFSTLINDNDGSGRRGWMEYGSGIGETKDVNQFVMMPLLDFTTKKNEIEVYVNDKKVESDVAPIMIEDRVLIPVRAMLEAIGAEVDWIDDTQTVVSKMGESTVLMQIGSKQLSVNGEIKEIDVPAQLVGARTLAPVRAISESFGCVVEWDDATNTVTITK